MKLDSDLDTLTQGAPPRRRFGWRRFGKYFGLFVLILAVLAGGTAVYVYKYVDNKIKDAGDPTIETDTLPPAVALTGTRNILVLGSDRRDVVEGGDKNLRQFKPVKGGEGQRSDTMMIIQLRDGGKTAIGLSFPRDLRVRLPGKSGWHKINAAYAGGPNYVMETIRELTGLKIHHYVEVNYTSFQRIVDAIGGLRLCVNRSYEDAQSGLYIPKAGCYNFNGSKSLAYVRMRKADPEGDFGRIKRQQLFMRELLKKVKDVGFLLDFRRVMRTADAVSKGLKTDTGLSLGLMRTIAGKLAGYSQANIDFRVVPSHHDLIGEVSYVVMEDDEATQLFAAMANDQPLPPFGKTSQSIPGPEDVLLDVRNASTVNGAARAWADRLEQAGYRIRTVDNAEKPRRRTQIAYQPGAELKARLLAETFPEAELVQTTNIGKVVDCVVLIGEDIAAEALPSPSASPAR